MLRSSIVSSRPLLSFPVRQRAAPQWLSRAGVSGRLAGQVRIAKVSYQLLDDIFADSQFLTV